MIAVPGLYDTESVVGAGVDQTLGPQGNDSQTDPLVESGNERKQIVYHSENRSQFGLKCATTHQVEWQVRNSS